MATQPQKVIITAGASGIGLAIAQAFVASGSDVFICDIAQETLEQALATHPALKGCVADVGNAQQVEAFIEQAVSALGGVDVLVNNAGIGGGRAAIEDIRYQDWDDTIRINLSGIFYCVKQVVPLMKNQHSGCILNIATTSAKTGLPFRLPYVASKAGVLGLTYNLARELGPFNIRCNSILPGMIDNARGRMLVETKAKEKGISVEEQERQSLQFKSMRSWIAPSEIGDMAVFLASDAARHVTGQEIAVDGNSEWEL